jgi:hypothetical protein
MFAFVGLTDFFHSKRVRPFLKAKVSLSSSDSWLGIGTASAQSYAGEMTPWQVGPRRKRNSGIALSV